MIAAEQVATHGGKQGAAQGGTQGGTQASFDDLVTPLCEVTFVVLDVETTGGSPATAALTEVAAARFRGGELLGTYQTFVRPDQRIPPFITTLTGISDDMVAEAPRIGEMLPSFLEFVGGAVLVGHNLRFDLSFLDHALVSTGREPFANATVDTLAMARRLVRESVPNCRLGTLAATLRLDHQPSHRALTDVLATSDLLHALLELAGSYGILGLAELLVLPKLVGHPHAAKLRLTTRLPRHAGIYWFTDAAGNVLYVGRAADIRAQVRSHFSSDARSNAARVLRPLHAVHHRACPCPLSSARLQSRLIERWSPPYNRTGRPHRNRSRRRRPKAPGSAPMPSSAPSAPGPGLRERLPLPTRLGRS
jgi:DNA polymerase-3 subunit epsilon